MRANKFHARGLQTPDGYFPSRGQYTRWQELKLLERGGEVVNLVRGERRQLIVNGDVVGHYTPDYEYVDSGQYIYEDFKGGPTHTEAAKLRIKLFEALYKTKVKITGRTKR